MGLGSKDLALLLRLTERGFIKRRSKLVEIGAQQLSNDFLRSEALIRELHAAYGITNEFTLPAPLPPTASKSGVELQSSAAPFARDLWIALGFEYTAIDLDESAGSVPLDLNFDRVPDQLKGTFDLVTNVGTTEHVCNQLNAFKIIHDLAGPGAVMIHHVPSGGMPNHALFNYNMKFFWHLSRSNAYTCLYADFYGGESADGIQDICDFIKQYAPDSTKTTDERKFLNYNIQIAFQKSINIPFVPPIDVHSGARTTNPAMMRRYWTVFRPDLLEALISGDISSDVLPQLSDDEY
jgi:hypothetical protein